MTTPPHVRAQRWVFITLIKDNEERRKRGLEWSRTARRGCT